MIFTFTIGEHDRLGENARFRVGEKRYPIQPVEDPDLPNHYKVEVPDEDLPTNTVMFLNGPVGEYSIGISYDD